MFVLKYIIIIFGLLMMLGVVGKIFNKPSKDHNQICERVALLIFATMIVAMGLFAWVNKISIEGEMYE